MPAKSAGRDRRRTISFWPPVPCYGSKFDPCKGHDDASGGPAAHCAMAIVSTPRRFAKREPDVATLTAAANLKSTSHCTIMSMAARGSPDCVIRPNRFRAPAISAARDAAGSPSPHTPRTLRSTSHKPLRGRARACRSVELFWSRALEHGGLGTKFETALKEHTSFCTGGQYGVQCRARPRGRAISV